MSIDSVISIAWDAFKCVVVPIKRQFGYVTSSKSYAQDLQKEVGKLAYEAEMVQNAVEVARNNSRNVYSYVTQWQANAEKALNEARDLLDDFEKATKTCCYGNLPEPSCRYQFSRMAKDKIEGIQRLTQEYSQFKDISSSGPAPGNVAALTPARREDKDVVQSATTTASASFASMSIKLNDDHTVNSRELIMQEIMAALVDNNNSVVGIYGMGGVGKSTLLDNAERRIRKEKWFDWVAKADVSENQDIKRIQGEIAHALDLDIKDVEYVNTRAERLRTRLEDEMRAKKKVLIILDNLWKGLDLKSVGIPCGHDNKVIGCKLLLTSRSQDVLKREMGCDRDFLLDKLEEEEAKRLFERTVGDKVRVDPFKSLVDEALRKCAGLPFLIITMAKHFKYADFPQWKDALKQIEMSTNKGISERINEMLQLSYNHFEGEDGKEAKSLLRLCVVYDVSKPSLEYLVRYGVGLKLFGENSSFKEARNRLSSLIQTLQASSLLLDDEDAYGFKIHDLVRGFVTSIASRDDLLLVLKDNDKSLTELPKDKLKNCTAVRFPYVDMKELLEELDCPEMQIFLLFTNNESLKIPNSYFNSMRKLRVLHLSQVRLTHSPSPFKFLKDLHTLCLDGCLLEDVAIIGELKGLHILSFVKSKIQQLPREIGQLAELRLLDLNHCSQLKIIEPGVLGSLMKLEELYMENSFDRWNAVEQAPPTNARLIELNNLKHLCTLHVSILDPSVLPKDLNVNKLTKYKIQIGDVQGWPIHKGLSTLQLQLDPRSDILQKGCIQTLLGKIDELFLEGSDRIEQSICILSQEGFQKLKHLHVKNSPSIHYILQSPSHANFKTLESLLINNLINLEKICNNHISSESFSALKVVRVESYSKMEVLFPLSLLRELPRLEEIRAIKCPLMREIVEVDDCGKVELHNLHVLELRDLPNVKNFFIARTAPSSSTSKDQVGTQLAFFNGQQVLIPSLESLTMAGLPNLEDLWTDESPLELSNLQFLKVSSCKSLSKVINSRSLIKLHKLHTLEVEDCISMQEIFDLDGLGAGANIETLSELNTIRINQLPSLRCIWNKNPCGIVRFHNLKKLQVWNCNNLRFLFSPSMVQSLAQLRELRVWYCKNMEAIIMEEEELRIETSKTLVFPMLTMLNLTALESLTCFSHRKCTPKAPDEDRVKSCPVVLFNQENLAFIFPALVALYLTQLEELEINECGIVELIEKEEGLVSRFVFPMLTSLKLEHLTKLKCIYAGKHASHWPALKTLEVRGCDKVEILASHLENEMPLLKQPLFTVEKGIIAGVEFMRLSEFSKLIEKWHNELIHINSYWHLKVLVVHKCPSFVNAIPSKLMLVLDKMKALQVCDCESLEEIFSLEGMEAMKSTRVLPQLEELDLVNLPKLRQLWNENLQGGRFNSLTYLGLYNCSNLRHAFAPSMAQCLANLEQIEIKECG
ncbi:probable disease resistance protein At4g27220 [Eucalyptus grandis]|uniref:probable disease resistance protein At4g27220 n=1 Tax=Eucalyptus grandis TaxID=71139 RepID=UPI00192E93EC|nr:probable disease resistance protein At4g27220 [Eucalyptus grandis]